MKQKLFSACVIVAALTLAGCASSSPPASVAVPNQDITEMKERILELQEQAAMAEVELGRLRQQITDLERRLGTAAPVEQVSEDEGAAAATARQSAPAAAGTGAAVVVEESDLVIETVAEESTQNAPVPPEPAPVTEAAAATQPVEPAAQALYDRGYTLYHQERYLDAEASFQRFLQAYPGTELSDNAQFWIGESRYARDDIQGALAAFREMLQRYPDGNKVPDALIKEGDCLAKLGDKDGARQRYDEVKQRFPGSGAAVMAGERLSGLD